MPLQRVERGDPHGRIRVAQGELDRLPCAFRQGGHLAQHLEAELPVDQRHIRRRDPPRRGVDGGGDARAPQPARGEQPDARIAIGQQREQDGKRPLARAGGQALERAQPLRVRQLGGLARGHGDRTGPPEIRVRASEHDGEPDRAMRKIAIVAIDGSISMVYASSHRT